MRIITEGFNTGQMCRLYKTLNRNGYRFDSKLNIVKEGDENTILKMYDAIEKSQDTAIKAMDLVDQQGELVEILLMMVCDRKEMTKEEVLNEAERIRRGES